MSNIYFREKLAFSKLRFSRQENLKKYTNFEEQKGTKYIRGERLILASPSSAVFRLQNRVSDVFLGNKRLLSEFLRK